MQPHNNPTQEDPGRAPIKRLMRHVKAAVAPARGAQAESMQVEAALRILKRLLKDFQGTAAFNLLGDTIHHIGRAGPSFTLLVRDLAVLRALVLERSPMPLVDGYINGRVDLDGDLYAALALRKHFSAVELPLRERWALVRDAWRLPHRPRQSEFTPMPGVTPTVPDFSHRHSKGSDQAAISFHYDVSNQFYALWLDRQMVYSCAYFNNPDDTLEQAQMNKLDHICHKLRLAPGERFLDVGCGWGALICWAARHYQVRAHGITLSRQQYDYAKARIHAAGLDHLVTVEIRDYRDLKGDAMYDKIASVGMFEHVGLANLPLYHATLHRLLRPGGLFLNHGITHTEEGWAKAITSEFINRYVFPDGELDTVSNLERGMEHVGFEIHDVEGLRPHYALTLRHWVNRLEAQREEALQHVNEATYRVWRFYMTACALEFESGEVGIFQILASRRDVGTWPLPLTRHDLYAAKPPTA